MSAIPAFESDGLLPPGDYEVSFDQLRDSVLVVGPAYLPQLSSWDTTWRRYLVGNLEILTEQLWKIGIRDVYADGSFAEDKDHPNDIDGYFVCELDRLRSGELTRELNLLDPYKVWTWAIGLNFTPIFRGWAAVFATNMETSLNSRLRFGNPVAMGSHEAL